VLAVVGLGSMALVLLVLAALEAVAMDISVMVRLALLERLTQAVEAVEQVMLRLMLAVQALLLSKFPTQFLPHSLVVSHLLSQLLLRDSTSTR
jgi:hypothetical protein